MACVIKALSLKEALLVVKRTELLPQVLESAVLDLEQGEGAEVVPVSAAIEEELSQLDDADRDPLSGNAVLSGVAVEISAA